MKEKVIVAWSGGKDSTLALHEIIKTEEYEIAVLLTTVTQEYDRVSMHGVRRVLLERQAESLGFALEKVFISQDTSNEEYGARMREVMQGYVSAGIRSVVFGDIFLEDLRKHREDNLAKTGARAIFPLWSQDTARLARTFIGAGFRAVITCVDSNALDKKYIGREYDERFLSELPGGVDPCGENGQFHSFVYDGPIFDRRIAFETGEIVLRKDRFYYCDLHGTPEFA
ncbi:MAG: Dph6-related ATP pyrophosphatase [Planctomycetota bacterium]|jgi:uncharacterized protein (TIGR00290 family)